MATVYLHIGTPKTGTTALQTFLPANEKALEQHGICYPDLHFRYRNVGSNRNARFLVARHFDKDGNRAYAKEKQDYETGLDRVQKLAAQYEKIILSDEGIWWDSQNWDTFWPDLKKNLEKRGLDIRIIVYFRRQDLWVQSHWAQKIKEGATYRFEEYLQLPVCTTYPLDYYQYMRKLAEVFGKEALILRVYEKEQYRGEEHSILSDFLDIFGLKMSDGFAMKHQIYNTSFAGNYLELRRYMNQYPNLRGIDNIFAYATKDVQNRNIEDRLAPKGAYFEKGEAAEFMKKFAESNAALAREFFGREDGRLFYQEIKDEPKTTYDREALLNDLVEICSRVCERLKEKDIREEKKMRLRYRDTGPVGTAKHWLKKKLGREA